MSTTSGNIPSNGLVGSNSNPAAKTIPYVTVARDLKYPSRSTTHIQWQREPRKPLYISKTQDLRPTPTFEYAPYDAFQEITNLNSSTSFIYSIEQGDRSLGGFKGKIYAVLKNIRWIPEKLLSFIRADRAPDA